MLQQAARRARGAAGARRERKGAHRGAFGCSGQNLRVVKERVRSGIAADLRQRPHSRSARPPFGVHRIQARRTSREPRCDPRTNVRIHVVLR
jgi:hypothetical protein